jgi:hypothetical protein
MTKKSMFAAVATLLLVGFVSAKHRFVNKEKIEKIKSSTTSWKPFEYENHPFRDLSEE